MATRIEPHELPDFYQGENIFWAAISPDIRLVLKNLEKSEDWIYYSEQFPELFEETSRMLPLIAPVVDLDEDTLSILDDLIMILSVMPFRQSIYALSWLETHSNDEFGWGMRIFDRAVSNLNLYTPGEILYDSSHVIKERVDALVTLDVSGQVFSSPMEKFN